ncbi:SUMF1/EgtB/PvdOfamily nonheme iron enzyme [Komarekiella sp. 'clone 1']|uniref:SUMF1/EgtB/PvdOfamily nonheme iron enzyme n=1 Tax=Komarekiella delphini-convector SJRDD-AB1 TaxID=2593771 RepID=A0AA40VVT8_9NOST|nr:SUMF1/EgtB/PvdO family nonheme iron enzyme [Komarekiella delphini-convector]MBD6621224.1 SUMF1/EgtB/PvdOfamily nonheme iron enzyme [Komarekiella delphini-convector SJRDD-AB1]
MNAQLTSAIVRICKANGEVVGAGFLVSQKHVLTCAHVVNAALSRSLAATENPTCEVYLDFPLVAPRQILKAQVVCWIAVQPSTSTLEFSDIAALELLDNPTERARPVRLVTAEDLWGHEFQVLGFPVGRDSGVWTAGELRQPVSGGRIQMEVVQQTAYRVESGFSGAPVWDKQLNGVVGMTVTAEQSRDRQDVKAAFIIPISQLVKAFPQLGEQAIPPCPYQGLFAFREEDAKFFFGREEFTTKLVASVKKQPLVAVIGSSGSGKSSVVFAGLIPQLRAQQAWIVESFRPGDRPLHNLAAKLVQLLPTQLSETDRLVEVNKLATALRQFDLTLQDVAGRILEKKIGTRLLLVADQFEELFTLCRDVEEQRCFIDQILTAVNHTPNFTLVLTLRADFLGYALSNRPFADALQGELLLSNPIPRNRGGAICLLGPMNRQELQYVIEKPASDLVQLEEGLSDRILDAVEKQPGNLPLLEFALTQLWTKQHNHQLTHQAYDAIGGVEKALAEYAQKEYNELSEADKERAKRIFIQLVRPGEGTEDTRRLATRAEVGEDNWDLVTHLANQRLVVTGRNETSEEETVEVIHEALIREWQQLRQWMEEDRSFRTWQERLRAAIRQWESSGKDDGALLRGVPLDEAEGLQHKRLEELSLEERVFIQLSLALRDREKQEREQIQQRELLLMRQSRTRLRSLVAVLGAIALGTTSVLAYPELLRWQADSLGTMVNIPEGNAIIGTDDSLAKPDEKPSRTVYIPAFQIEQYEVSNQQYRLCQRARVCSEPKTELLRYIDSYINNINLNHPIVGITAVQAAKYCHWLGRRLPTEVEWERAARGSDGRLWPWGNGLPTPKYANLLFENVQKGTEPVNSHSEGVSPEDKDIFNLVGNVAEWTASYFDQQYQNSDQKKAWDGQPEKLRDKVLLIRGGNWRYKMYRVTERFPADGLSTHARVGIRCAK